MFRLLNFFFHFVRLYGSKHYDLLNFQNRSGLTYAQCAKFLWHNSKTYRPALVTIISVPSS